MVETTVFYQANGNTSMSKLNDKLLAELVTIGRKMDFHVFAIKPWEGFSERLAVANSTIDPHPNERGHEILAADEGLLSKGGPPGVISTERSG